MHTPTPAIRADTPVTYDVRLDAIRLAGTLEHIFEINRRRQVAGESGVPICISGTHGLGKTSAFKAFAKKYGWEFAYCAPARFEEMGDLHGLPTPVGPDPSVAGDERTVFLPPDWVPTEEGPGILLLDDMNRAYDRILRAIIQLLQEFEIFSWTLPLQWQIVCVCNPEGGDYAVTPMDDAMITRTLHVTLEFDVKTWAWDSSDPRQHGLRAGHRYDQCGGQGPGLAHHAGDVSGGGGRDGQRRDGRPRSHQSRAARTHTLVEQQRYCYHVGGSCRSDSGRRSRYGRRFRAIGCVGGQRTGHGSPSWAVIPPVGYCYQYVTGTGAAKDVATARRAALEDTYQVLRSSGPRAFQTATFRQEFESVGQLSQGTGGVWAVADRRGLITTLVLSERHAGTRSIAGSENSSAMPRALAIGYLGGEFA